MGGRKIEISAELLGKIYDSAVDRTAWERLPGVLAGLTGAQTCAVYYDTGRAVGDLATHNLAEPTADYVNHYHKLDPWLAMGRANPRLMSLFGEEIIAQSEFAESEYCRDFARHWGIFYLLGVNAPLAPGLCFNVGLHRPPDQGPFSPESKTLLNSLLPHIQRALQLRLRLIQAEARAGLGFAALSTLGFAAIVCNAAGTVEFANAMAEKLAANGSGMKLAPRNGITFQAPMKTQELHSLIHDAATGGSGGAMRVECAGTTYLVLVAPLPGKFDGNAMFGSRALVAVNNAADDPGFERKVMSALFGLTSAEAELAISLLTSKSVEQIASERKVKMPTLRTQLRNIFAKTGTENQRDLVRLLGSIPQVRRQTAI